MHKGGGVAVIGACEGSFRTREKLRGILALEPLMRRGRIGRVRRELTKQTSALFVVFFEERYS